jgi:hypothetical protein
MKTTRFFLVFFVSLLISACTITNPKPDVCEEVRPYRGTALYPTPKIYPIKQGMFEGVVGVG